MTLFRPSSAQNVYILSLTDKNKSIWTDASQLRLGSIHNGLANMSLYLWDLYNFADRYANKGSGGYATVSALDIWNPLWVDAFNDNAGSSIYQPYSTIFPVSSFNRINAQDYTYKGTISLSPLLTRSLANDGTDETETFDAEVTLYNAFIFPAYPILITSSVEANEHFGPCFISEMSFESEGMSQLSPVKITASFIGGKTIKCPIIPSVIPDTVDGNNGDDQVLPDYRHYRTAALLDCFACTGSFTNKEDITSHMADLFASESIDPQTRLISMKLSMKQNVEMQVVMATGTRTVEHGPRYANITKREIEGEVMFYSSNSHLNPLGGLMATEDEKSIVINTNGDTSSLSMYFGGPFLFSMPNIEFNKPTSVMQAGKGFLHTYSFRARSAPNANLLPFGAGFDAGTDTASEFIINDYGG